MSSWLAPAITGLLGVFAGICAQWWRSSRDEFRILSEEFCKLISEAGELGAAYWASDSELVSKEARLRGFQKRIAGYNILFGSKLHETARDEIDTQLSRLFDALTGGTFSEKERPIDFVRVTYCHDAAAETVLAVRRGFIDRVSLREKLWRGTVGRHWPRPAWHSRFQSDRT